MWPVNVPLVARHRPRTGQFRFLYWPPMSFGVISTKRWRQYYHEWRYFTPQMTPNSFLVTDTPVFGHCHSLSWSLTHSLLATGRSGQNQQSAPFPRAMMPERFNYLPLRHLHRHLEEPVGGIRWGVPCRIRQALLAPDGVDALNPVGVQVRRPGNPRNAPNHLYPRCKYTYRIRRVSRCVHPRQTGLIRVKREQPGRWRWACVVGRLASSFARRFPPGLVIVE